MSGFSRKTLQSIDPNPVAYEGDKHFARRTKLLFLLYGVLGLLLTILF